MYIERVLHVLLSQAFVYAALSIGEPCRVKYFTAAVPKKLVNALNQG